MTRKWARSGLRAATARPAALGAVAALVVSLLASAPSSADPGSDAARQASGTCALAAGQSRTAVAVAAPDVIALDDGTEVKLAGVIGARAHDTAAATADWPPEIAAVRALADLVVGRTVSIHPIAPQSDRYRRLVAHVFIERDADRIWVQAELLALGHARAFALAGTFTCADELLAHEREARRHKTGLWAHAAYSERAAYRTRELMRLRGTFQIVGGRVRKVSEMKSAIYLNFGTDWHSDFTAGIKIGKGATADAGFAAKMRGLEGRRVRVRGWVDRRNGPYIEIGHPSEIEILDDGPLPAGLSSSAVAGSNEKRPGP